MSRPTKSKFHFAFEEVVWLARSLSRYLQQLERNEKSSPRMKDVVTKFSDKLANLMMDTVKTDDILLTPNRHELRIIDGLIEVERNVLLMNVIPGYADKMKKDKAHYGPYKDAAERKADMLLELQNRVRRSL